MKHVPAAPAHNLRTLSFTRTLLACAALVVAPLLTSPVRAQIAAPENGFGIGFMLGTPTGLSASLPIGDANAFNATLGYDLGGSPNLYAQVSYVWIAKDIIPVDVGSISAYYGPGAFVLASRDAALGIQAIGGIDYRFATAPVQVFLEIGPGITLLPDTSPHASAGLGVRYYF
ncbi:MAG TPA: hypothetical protein VKZ88_06705 [Fibrobacteria bacterium]|jgi:hypothetical protein|nr:hypothetical protein [Fibrobacteria bacterium]